jgi:hypothetical protein
MSYLYYTWFKLYTGRFCVAERVSTPTLPAESKNPDRPFLLGLPNLPSLIQREGDFINK